MIHTIARYYNTLGAQGSDVVRVLNQEGRGPENHYNSIPQDVYKERLFEISSVNQTWLAGKTLNMIKKKGGFQFMGTLPIDTSIPHHFASFIWIILIRRLSIRVLCLMSQQNLGCSQVRADYQSLLQDHQSDDPQLQGSLSESLGWDGRLMRLKKSAVHV
jgi:hypothetical protein